MVFFLFLPNEPGTEPDSNRGRQPTRSSSERPGTAPLADLVLGRTVSSGSRRSRRRNTPFSIGFPVGTARATRPTWPPVPGTVVAAGRTRRSPTHRIGRRRHPLSLHRGPRRPARTRHVCTNDLSAT